MITNRRARRLSRAFVVLLVAGFAGLVQHSQAPVVADSRTVTVDPATNLGAQVVKVSWTGFDPSDFFGDFAVQVYECRANPKTIDKDGDPNTIDDCLAAARFPASQQGNALFTGATGDDGTGSAFFELRDTVTLANDSLQCNHATPCSIVAFEADGNPIPTDHLPETAKVVPLEFAATTADCPSVQNFDVRIEGEASAASTVYGWASRLCNAKPPLVVDYTESSSNSGRASLETGQVDAAITSTPPLPDELSQAGVKASDYVYAPLSVNAVVFAYNMTDRTTGERVTDLKLSPRLVTRLITDTRLGDFFNDPEFVALNPRPNGALEWPGQGLVEPLVRSGANADARIVTGWMGHDPASQHLLANADDHGVPLTNAWKGVTYPADAFEDRIGDGSYVPITGSYNAAVRVFYAVSPSGAAIRTTNEGFIGVMDRTMAARLNLPVASIVNGAGVAVAPTDASILAAVPQLSDQGGVLSPNFDDKTAAAYPLTKVDYVMVPKALAAARKPKVARLLRYAADATAADLPLGVLPLTPTMRATTLAIAKSLDPVTPTSSSTTTPTGSTTSTSTSTSSTSTTAPLSTATTSSYVGGGSNSTDSSVPSDGSTPTTGAGGGASVTTRGSSTTVRRKLTIKAPSWSPISALAGGGGGGFLPLLFLTAFAVLLVRLVALGRRRAQALRKSGAEVAS